MMSSQMMFCMLYTSLQLAVACQRQAVETGPLEDRITCTESVIGKMINSYQTCQNEALKAKDRMNDLQQELLALKSTEISTLRQTLSMLLLTEGELHSPIFIPKLY